MGDKMIGLKIKKEDLEIVEDIKNMKIVCEVIESKEFDGGPETILIIMQAVQLTLQFVDFLLKVLKDGNGKRKLIKNGREIVIKEYTRTGLIRVLKKEFRFKETTDEIKEYE